MLLQLYIIFVLKLSPYDTNIWNEALRYARFYKLATGKNTLRFIHPIDDNSSIL